MSKSNRNKSSGIPIVIQSTQTSVQAGVIDDISSIIKKLFDTIFKGIDSIFKDRGYEHAGETIQQVDDSKFTINWWHTGEPGVDIAVGYCPIEGRTDAVNVVVGLGNCKKNTPMKSWENVKEYPNQTLGGNKLKKIAEQFAESVGKSLEEPVTNASKCLRITLQRVTSGKEDTINLMKIQANYPIQLAMEDVQEVVEDDEFADTLTEEPQSFEITEVPSEENPNEIEYDVNGIENDEVDGSFSYEELLKAAAKFYFDLLSLAWGAKGTDMEDLRNRVSNFRWTAESAFNMFAELMVAETHVVPHLGKLATGGTGGVDMSQGFDYQEGLTVLDKSIDKFIQTLEEHYINLSHEVQKRVDDMIYELKNGYGGNIKRAMM